MLIFTLYLFIAVYGWHWCVNFSAKADWPAHYRMSCSSWLWKVLLSDWHEVSEWPCLQASGLKLVWDSSFFPSFFLGRLSSLTRNFYNLRSDCPLWILNNNSMCPDPIYCRVEYDPKGQAGRLLQTPFCMAIFSVMFQTLGVIPEGYRRSGSSVDVLVSQNLVQRESAAQ